MVVNDSNESEAIEIFSEEEVPYNKLENPAATSTPLKTPKKRIRRPTQADVTEPTKQTESTLWGYFASGFKAISKLYYETKIGPWQLGVIDTTKYDRNNLDVPLFELTSTILDLQGRKKWIMTQFVFFFRPIFHGLGGPMVNRLDLFLIQVYFADDKLPHIRRIDFTVYISISTIFLAQQFCMSTNTAPHRFREG